MKNLRFLTALLLVGSVLVTIVPIVAAQPTPPDSAGCAAIGQMTTIGETTIALGSGEFFAGDVISVIVTGVGDTFALLDGGEVIKEVEVGSLLLYAIPTSGTYDFSVTIYGDTADDTTALTSCMPVSETDSKVEICHIPPGNPENAHTIRVGVPAMVAHLAHGDSIGACAPQDESSVQNLNAGITYFIFNEDWAVEIYGDCVEDQCSLILTLDLTVLVPEAGAQFLFESEVSDSIYVIIYYVDSCYMDTDFQMFQINVYNSEDALLDDSILLFMNADGDIVGWDTWQAYLGRTELPGWFYDAETE